jgi:hypothetical protein
MNWYPNDVYKLLGKHYMFGMEVYTQDNELTKRPKLKVSPGICSEAFTEKMNQWLAERFGFEYQAYNVEGRLIIHSDVLKDIDAMTR